MFRFLDQLSRATLALEDADELLSTTTLMTAAHLGLSNCAYADMDEDQDGFTIRGNWHAPGSPSILGHYRLADFGALAVQELSAGRPLIINDNLREIAPQEAKTFQDLGIAATICMPLVKAGRLVALMAIHDKLPHQWTDYEQVVIREVTERSWAHVERVRSDAELRSSNARFQAAIRATKGVLWTNDPQGRMIGEQPGWGVLTGQSYEEYQGFGWADLVHPDDAEPTVAAWNAAVAAKSTFVFEHRLRLADASWGLFSIRAVPSLDEDGEVTEWVGVHTDITEERARDEALRDSNETLEVLNKTGSAIAAELDLERLVQMVTDAGVELTGARFGAFFYNVLDRSGEKYLLYSLAGANRSDFDKFGMPRATAIFHPTFMGEGVVRSNDITTDERYGKNLPHNGMPEGHLPVRSYLAVSVTSRSGEILGGLFFGHPALGRFTDRHERLITGIAAQAAVGIDNARLYDTAQNELANRILAESALREANETLEQRVQEETARRDKAEEALRQSQKMETLGQLTGGIAHDFNNLLQIVAGNLDLLRRKLPDDASPLRRYADRAVAGAERAAVLTQRLLAFSRRQPLAPKPTEINRLLPGMSELLHRTLGETIEVEAVLPPRLWLVETDPNQLENAILNLAVNARDAMPDGGKLTIETQNTHLDEKYAAQNLGVAPGQYVVICISDTGVGMDPDTVTKAVEPFFTTKEVGKGTGLGLSMVYGFIKQSGGHLRIYSELGEGTTVKIYLPRLVGDRAAEAEDEPALTPAEGGAETILVCEDDEDVRAYSAEVLRELGYLVLEAADGAAALAMVKDDKVKIDMLFTDVVLPGGMSGAELAKQAAAFRPKLKTLFTTGYARNAIVHHGRLDPGVELITKPFSYGDLAERIRDTLDKDHQRARNRSGS